MVTTVDSKAQFFETFEGVKPENVDETASVVKDVKVIGFTSRNRRTYTESALQRAVPLYEGVTVYLDHPKKPNDARSVTEQFGNIRNARFVEGKGVFADLHYNPEHSYAKPFVWEAKNNPTQVGLSHNASVTGKRLPRELVVESINGVRSVDLVADAATTKSLFEAVSGDDEGLLSESEYGFEGVISDKLRDDAEHRAFRQVVDAAKSLMSRTLWNDDLTLAAMRASVVAIASDLVAELNKPTTPATEGADMSTKAVADLTIDELRTLITEQAEEAGKETALEAVTRERDELKARVEKIELAEAVRKEIAAAEFEDGQVSEDFIQSLIGLPDQTRKSLIEDRKKVFVKEQVEEPDKKSTHKKPVTTSATESTGTALSAVDLAGRLSGKTRIGGLA